VWTYDLYRAYLRPNEPDGHYVTVGRIATVVGVILSIGTAYAVLAFESILDYLQLLHGIFLAPLFATFLLGMFWRGTTPWGGFTGLVVGTACGLGIWGLELMGVVSYGSPMAGNFWRSIWVWTICFVVTIVVSLLTSRTRKSDEELRGLVWGLTEKKEAVEPAWYKKPWVLATTALAITVALNIIFF
ncbi:MAG: Na+/galactose cotransporter, partial [Actinomycetota bacterium]|nr:Na+/galactose cotransporter [Actinomycetota bacterium]